uniref:Non-specific serine/threonine protein kinase n=1 Tax=Rhabditophanes sp. KR3021 TaxID=114890 RepID=A0AC35TQK7_9BILA
MDDLKSLATELLSAESAVSVDGLIDTLIAVVQDCNYPHLRKTKSIDFFLTKYERLSRQLADSRINYKSFDLIKVIGRGAFGEVQLVRHKDTRKVFALKLLEKSEMLRKPESAFFWEERHIMAYCNSEWVVKLHYSFQDSKCLFMAMEFMPGGDLVGLINNYEVSENWARFYLTEVCLALDAIHQMGYIHRDVKPDNMLISASGHIKLADFGTCVKMDGNGLAKCESAVGTPDYISPEILASNGQGGTYYNKAVDFWSVGVFLYEMLVGETPFYADSLCQTYASILAFENNLTFPPDITLSDNVKDVISKFLTHAETRLGRNGLGDIKEHPFFKNDEYTFDTIGQVVPPHVPVLNGDDDHSNFVDIEDRVTNPADNFQSARNFAGNQLPFVGFTYCNELGPIKELKRMLAAEPIQMIPPPKAEVQSMSSQTSPTLPHPQPVAIVQEPAVGRSEVSELLKKFDQARVTLPEPIASSPSPELTKPDFNHQLIQSSPNKENDAKTKEMTTYIASLQDNLKSLQSELEMARTNVEKDQLATNLNIAMNEKKSLEYRIGELQEQLETEQTYLTAFKSELHTKRDEIAERDKKLYNLSKLESSWDNLKQQLRIEQELRMIAEDSLNALEKEKTMLNLELRQTVMRNEKEKEGKVGIINTLSERERSYENEIHSLREELQLVKTHNIKSQHQRQSSATSNQDSYGRCDSRTSNFLNQSKNGDNIENMSKEELIKRVRKEIILKENTVSKLQEVMMKQVQLNPKKESKKKLMKVDQEKRSLEMKLEQQRVELRHKEYEWQNASEEYKCLIDQERERVECLQNEVDECKHVIDELSRCRDNDTASIASHDNLLSLTSEPIFKMNEIKHSEFVWIRGRFINKRKINWVQLRVEITVESIQFFPSDSKSKQPNVPLIIIKIPSVVHLRRKCTSADVKEDEIAILPNLFQIIYFAENSTANAIKKDNLRTIEHRGHSFVELVFKNKINCDKCVKTLHNLKDDSAIQCLRKSFNLYQLIMANFSRLLQQISLLPPEQQRNPDLQDKLLRGRDNASQNGQCQGRRRPGHDADQDAPLRPIEPAKPFHPFQPIECVQHIRSP